eukprot:scaffold1170_cov122-Cylindrotheca_fusiformis.AAC.3
MDGAVVEISGRASREQIPHSKHSNVGSPAYTLAACLLSKRYYVGLHVKAKSQHSVEHSQVLRGWTPPQSAENSTATSL